MMKSSRPWVSWSEAAYRELGAVRVGAQAGQVALVAGAGFVVCAEDYVGDLEQLDWQLVLFVREQRLEQAAEQVGSARLEVDGFGVPDGDHGRVCRQVEVGGVVLQVAEREVEALLVARRGHFVSEQLGHLVEVDLLSDGGDGGQLRDDVVVAEADGQVFGHVAGVQDVWVSGRSPDR